MSPRRAAAVASTIRLNGLAKEPLRVAPVKALSTNKVRVVGFAAGVNAVAARNQKSKLPPARPSPSPSRAVFGKLELVEWLSDKLLATELLKSRRSWY